jgi:membrane protease YdiL (CAAX protease family)
MEDINIESALNAKDSVKINKDPFSNIASAFLVFGIFILASIVVALPFGIIQNYIGPQFKSLINFLSYTLSMVLLLYITVKIRKSYFFSWEKVPAFVFLLCIPLVLSIGIILEPVSNLIPMPVRIQKLFADMVTRDIFSFLMIVIAALVLEELVFRGIILDGLLKRYSPQKAIFWSAFIFGLVHMNPWQFIGAFMVGSVMGWVYFKTRSLIPCILMHLVNNLAGFLFLFYSNDTTGITFGLVKSNNWYLAIYLGCIPLFVWIAYILNREMKKFYDKSV